jgi:ABC-type nitrate/sulfonate/bicarbonate transport system substrate-binding protein
VLTDAQGIAPSNSFFLASRDYASAHPDVIKAVVEETTQAWHWAQNHQNELAQLLSTATGVDLEAEKLAAARANYEIAYLTPAVVRQQQSIADAFAKLGLLPHPIDVHLAVWTASGGKSLTAAP